MTTYLTYWLTGNERRETLEEIPATRGKKEAARSFAAQAWIHHWRRMTPMTCRWPNDYSKRMQEPGRVAATLLRLTGLIDPLLRQLPPDMDGIPVLIEF